MGFILAPNGRWSARDKVGEAAIGAFVFTYVNQTRNFKNTFADPGGQVLNPNPIQLDSSGVANIYWEDDEYYTIEIWSVDDSNPTVPFELIYTQDNYPAVTGGSGGDIVINQTFPNLVRNSQFTRWGNNNYLSPDTTNDTLTRLGQTGVFGETNNVCDDWYLTRSNTQSIITISRKQFALGQTEVPANPVNYLNYACTGIGAGGETFKGLLQEYDSVQTLSNVEVSIGIWAKSSSSSTLAISLRQDYGSGGAPSSATFTNFINVSLTPVWTQYTGTAIVGSVAGKTLGTDNNNRLTLDIRFPLNQLANVDLCNVQMHTASEVPVFAYLSVNDQLKRSDTTVNQAVIPTGTFICGIFNTSPEGWVLCNDSTIGSFFSGSSYAFNETLNLYILLWNNVSNTFAPIFTSTGAVSTRGASAIADFNADKRLQLTRVLGRVIGASGAGSGLTARTLGQFLGEENHQLTIAEMPSHNHTQQWLPNSLSTGNSGGARVTPDVSLINTGSRGGDQAHNTMQPTMFATYMIKL